jgi:hypothetical protein
MPTEKPMPAAIARVFSFTATASATPTPVVRHASRWIHPSRTAGNGHPVRFRSRSARAAATDR